LWLSLLLLPRPPLLLPVGGGGRWRGGAMLFLDEEW